LFQEDKVPIVPSPNQDLDQDPDKFAELEKVMKATGLGDTIL
jgi:hypothetical protein